ncbi:hypothetical protein AOC36_02095 [Erysipelothrix larvae]|uniref:HTH luxR-type domain-containing protein n=1 Tax=Erysipelothrix larvae TaxID=1514105 RepID=A0A0X8GYM3_9FIRM|nr:sigma-70 family RNA polymerase sigma factor [Erysipelothrix larvae]AMC92817.1 hypothetical protein AOC36_02095 [Erysipelothrix larvae]
MTLDIRSITEFQNGNLSAFDDIYDECYNRVYYKAYEMIKDEGIAKDIAQNVFIIVFEKLNQLEVPKAFYTWLDRITRNCTIREIKNSSKTDVSFFNETDSEQIADSKTLPNEAYNSQEILKIILTEIKSLPNGQKEVAIMRFCNNQSISEIADELRIPEGTVKSRINTVKKNLQETLTLKKISPNTLYTFLPILQVKLGMEMFNALKISTPEVTEVASSTIPDVATSTTALGQRISEFFKETQIPIRTIATVAVITPVAFGSLNAIDQFAPVSIKSITFKEEPTNEPVVVSIDIKNASKISSIYVKNTDSQAIYPVNYADGSIANVQVDENGSYEVIIESAKKEIQTQDFQIQSLDYVAPHISNISFDANHLYVTFVEETSSISLDNSSLTIGESISNAQLSESEDTLIFDLPPGAVNGSVMIYDTAGNYTQTEINITNENID